MRSNCSFSIKGNIMPMATTYADATIIFLLLLMSTAGQSFVFNSFESARPNLTLSGASLITPTGILQLTNSSRNLTSNVFYSNPFHLLSRPNLTAVSFSTTFVFSILTSIRGGAGGHGFTFAISPTSSIPPYPSANPNYLALINPSNDGNASNHIFAVEFDTAQSSALDPATANSSFIRDINDNHIGIDINGMKTIAAKPVSYYDDATKTQIDLQMESDNAFQVWIDYDGPFKILNITIAPLRSPKPTRPLITHPIDLSPVFELPSMFVGFTSATGKLASAHYILAWSFRLNRNARPLDLTKIPKRPTWADGRPRFKNITGLRVGAATSAATLMILVCVVFACVLVVRRIKLRDVLEEWEVDFPHRFKYADLHAATNGFSDAMVVGQGGFGCVYKGVLPKTKQLIAVKKIAHNSKQGLKEFVAEVATLGKLRHRHLVHLEGWCKRSSHLLLVYEFMSNGSLDSFLFNPSQCLPWSERFRIIKEVAAGLVYLHHEWEQVVVHRDIKANNVLLDFNMTAKLGDFGLAKLYEHGENPATTHVVGTVGYIAPELAHNGKATTRSDVYAFGALVFEVVCGRRPLDPNTQSEILLQDWVWDCYKMGHVGKVIDPKLGNQFVKSEMELVLKVGLMCSQYEADDRPSMHQVDRYLGGFDTLTPEVIGEVKDVGWSGMDIGIYSDPPSSGGILSTASFGTSGR